MIYKETDVDEILEVFRGRSISKIEVIPIGDSDPYFPKSHIKIILSDNKTLIVKPNWTDQDGLSTGNFAVESISSSYEVISFIEVTETLEMIPTSTTPIELTVFSLKQVIDETSDFTIFRIIGDVGDGNKGKGFEIEVI